MIALSLTSCLKDNDNDNNEVLTKSQVAQCVNIVRGEYTWRGGNMILSEDQHCLVMNQAHDRSALNELTFIARESDAGYMADLAAWVSEQDLRPLKSKLIIVM